VLRAGGSQANAVLRNLVGGQITLEEASREGRRRKHYVAVFALTTRAVVNAMTQGENVTNGNVAMKTEVLRVELRDHPPWVDNADAVKERFDAGMEYRQIAKELGCPYSHVAKALAAWHRQRGLPVLDGRKEKARLDRPTKPKELSAPAKDLWNAGLPMHEIASRLGCNVDTVTAAIKHWFVSRGLPVPDGRHRRKELRAERPKE
jgi:hypothetical protein